MFTLQNIEGMLYFGTSLTQELSDLCVSGQMHVSTGRDYMSPLSDG